MTNKLKEMSAKNLLNQFDNECSHLGLDKEANARYLEMRAELLRRLEVERAARKAIKLILGQQNGVPWADVREEDVDSYIRKASEVEGGVACPTNRPSCPKCGSEVRMYKGTVDGDVSIIWVKCAKDHRFKCETVADFAQFFRPAPSVAERTPDGETLAKTVTGIDLNVGFGEAGYKGAEEFRRRVLAALQSLPTPSPSRHFCQHCRNRIYLGVDTFKEPRWYHHGSNLVECFGGLDTCAEPAETQTVTQEQARKAAEEIAELNPSSFSFVNRIEAIILKHLSAEPQGDAKPRSQYIGDIVAEIIKAWPYTSEPPARQVIDRVVAQFLGVTGIRLPSPPADKAAQKEGQ